MSDNIRHPFRNFFIKKSVQFRITFQIFITVFFISLLTLGLLIFIYNTKSHAGSFYYMSNDIMQDLELKSILGIILPPIVAAEIVAVLLGFGIGLFYSRKIAVPLYKIEKWANRLRHGKLNTTLAFREEDRLKDITVQCNSVTEFYRNIFSEIQTHVGEIAENSSNPEKVAQNSALISKIMNRIEL